MSRAHHGHGPGHPDHDHDPDHRTGPGDRHRPGPHHGHVHGAGASERRIGWAALLTGTFMLAEVFGGLVSGSLALLADAGHMLTDFAGLLLAWLGLRLARRPADWKRSYGYDRFGVLAAFTNGLALFAIAGWIVVEAIHRLSAPSEVLGGVMLAVALAGLAVNLLAFWLLSGGAHDNLNIRAAALHVMGDLLGSVAAIAASLVILATGWTPVDPLLSVLVAVLILGAAWRIVGEAGHILLEGTPSDIDVQRVGRDIKAAVPAVTDVHHVHAWSLSQSQRLITLHVRVADGVDTAGVRRAVRDILEARYGIDHATIEIEHPSHPVQGCDGPGCGGEVPQSGPAGAG